MEESNVTAEMTVRSAGFALGPGQQALPTRAPASPASGRPHWRQL
jgi:hypothetical protein